MKAAVSTACFYPQYLEKTVEYIGGKGIKNIEIFFNCKSEMISPFLPQLKSRLDFYGINVVSAHPYSCESDTIMLFTDYERRFNDGIDEFKCYFEAMNIVGAKILVFHGAKNTIQCSDEYYYERFAKLRDIGKTFGITVAQENIERCKSHSVEFLEKMGKYLDGDLSLVFDNKQAKRSKVSYEYYIERLAQYIAHVHLSDNNEYNACLPIGKGNLNIEYVLQLLNAHKYNGTVVVELYSRDCENDEEVIDSYEKICKIADKFNNS